jgi:hypothetical protein
VNFTCQRQEKNILKTLDASGFSDTDVVFNNLVCDKYLIVLDFYDGCL